jgi:hypothetical protein
MQKPMSKLLLIGTEACHLCEEAEMLLQQAGLSFSSIDIIDDDSLQQQYGLLIPVLLHDASQKTLNWPFNLEQLNDFLQDIDL